MDQLWNPARLAIGFVLLFAIFVPPETLFPPARYPEKYGINEPMPSGYLGQMAQPFKKRE